MTMGLGHVQSYQKGVYGLGIMDVMVLLKHWEGIMIKWEYRTMIELGLEEVDPSDTDLMRYKGIFTEEESLNKFGNEGWELAGMTRVGRNPDVDDYIDSILLVFKRPVEE